MISELSFERIFLGKVVSRPGHLVCERGRRDDKSVMIVWFLLWRCQRRVARRTKSGGWNEKETKQKWKSTGTHTGFSSLWATPWFTRVPGEQRYTKSLFRLDCFAYIALRTRSLDGACCFHSMMLFCYSTLRCRMASMSRSKNRYVSNIFPSFFSTSSFILMNKLQKRK